MANGSGSILRRRSKVFDLTLVVVCLLAGGLAVLSRVRQEAGADLDGVRQLDTPESATLYVCPNDGATLSVTPAGFDRMLAAGQAGPREGAPRHCRGMCLRCPTCGKRLMVPAVRCPEDGTVFARVDEHGHLCVCPRCLTSPLASGLDYGPLDEGAG